MDRCAVPCYALSYRIGRPISMTMRIGMGFFIQILALVSAAIIEMIRYRVVRSSGIVDAFLAQGGAVSVTAARKGPTPILC